MGKLKAIPAHPWAQLSQRDRSVIHVIVAKSLKVTQFEMTLLCRVIM